jgi:hypothetical protein
MNETIALTRVIEGELPFTLNLPEGTCPVQVDGTIYPIELQQNRIAAAADRDAMLIGRAEDVRTRLEDRWESSYVQELRTIVRNRRDVAIRHADFPAPTHDQLFEVAQSYLLREQPNGFPGGPTELQPAARSWLNNLSADDRSSFTTDTSVRLAAAATFPWTEAGHFCGVLNVLTTEMDSDPRKGNRRPLCLTVDVTGVRHSGPSADDWFIIGLAGIAPRSIALLIPCSPRPSTVGCLTQPCWVRDPVTGSLPPGRLTIRCGTR